MSSNAVSSQTTQLKIGDGGGTEVFTAIGDVVSINGPNETRETIDVTDLDSTGREFKAALKDGGELTFETNYRPTNTQHIQLETDYDSGVLRNFQLVFSDTGNRTYSFAALITNLSPVVQAAEVLRRSITLKLSGAVTRAA
jgi:predicted secreted protein